MPAAPADGMTITFSSTQQITALTMAGNGATLVGATTFMRAESAVTYIYRLANTTWYPTLTVPDVSSLISGTSQASTSGTSIDFTGIPSLVKWINVMFSGVSTNGSSNLIVQLGDSGGIEVTGYESLHISANTAAAASAVAYTTGLGVTVMSPTLFTKGVGVLYLLNPATNTWVWGCNSNLDLNGYAASGSKSLSGTLDRVRITTVNGTDTFDAGSINILYE
jgi:hypothetical protein